MSLQPSEIAKVCYIFAGSATLDRLFRKKNLGLFMALTLICLGCLALMNDFGAAAIFFVTFIVIAFLRSGDWATLALICGGCGAGGLVLLSVKPHVLKRFASWGHIWEDVYGAGFQQTHSLTAAASGGLVGVGAGNGWLGVTAADTDMVFCKVCEEWGLIIAVLAVLCIVTLAVFAVRACRAGRSSFYTIAACAATSLMVFQTCLKRLWRGRHPAPDRCHLPLPVQRRYLHVGFLGHAGLPEGIRHQTERKLCHPPALAA